jgi:predicted RNA polymerase sigma factor
MRDEPGILSLLAPARLTHTRRGARLDPAGKLVASEDLAVVRELRPRSRTPTGERLSQRLRARFTATTKTPVSVNGSGTAGTHGSADV